MPCFIGQLMTILVLIGMVFMINLRDNPQEDIFKLSASASPSEFCQSVQVGIDVYIPIHIDVYSLTCHHGFQVLVLLSQFIEITFFICTNQNKSSESKVKLKQASNHYKSVLGAAKLAYATKTKESVTSQNLGSCDFWRITNSALNKD